MGISAEYVRITLSDHKQLLQQPEKVEFYLGHYAANEKNNLRFDHGLYEMLKQQGRVLVIGNRWQAIHYLLTREVTEPGKSRVLPPLGNVIMGGHPLDAVGYEDCVRYLMPDEVEAVAIELRKLAPEQVKAAFYCDTHLPISIYKSHPPSQWDEDDLSDLIGSYDLLRQFYLVAANENDAMLIWVG
jgi:hypothetical protein